MKTIREFAEEVRAIRAQMYVEGEHADVKLVASWLDRLLISLEKIAPTLDMMAVELEELANSEPMEPARPHAQKRAKKKKAKKRG